MVEIDEKTIKDLTVALTAVASRLDELNTKIDGLTNNQDTITELTAIRIALENLPSTIGVNGQIWSNPSSSLTVIENTLMRIESELSSISTKLSMIR